MTSESPSPSDRELLARVVRDGVSDGDAFTQLVRRHGGFVLACARRQLDPGLAEEAAQAVFLVLARKAASLDAGVVLSSWLFRTTRFVAARLRRAEERRRRREHLAAQMDLQPHSPPASPESTPDRVQAELSRHLDEALAALPESDRRFVLTRFFEGCDFEGVGARFGVSGEAARKRVTRALDRMRRFLARRDVVLSTAALATVLPRFRAEAAPPAWVASVRVALQRSSPTAGSPDSAAAVVDGVARDWAWHGVRRFLGGWALPVLVLVTALWGVSRLGREATAPGRAEGRGSATVLAATGAAAPGRLENPDREPLGLRVVDAPTGTPLPGTEILVETWDARRGLNTVPVRTGPAGTCRIPIGDPGYRLLRVWVSAPGHVPVVMEWHRHELNGGALSHTCRLERGQVFSGWVRNESGDPVAGAMIRVREPGLDPLRRENIGFHPRATRVVTDDQGRFRSDQMPGDWITGPMHVFVRHPDYGPLDYAVERPEAWATNHLVVLPAGVRLRGRVGDPGGAPVAGAKVRHASGDAWPEDETFTDHEGAFEFPHVAQGPFPFTVEATGFDRHQGFVEASGIPEPVEVRLAFAASRPEPDVPPPPRTLRIRARVLDAFTDSPVPRFQVYLADSGGSPRLLGEGRVGAIDWEIDASYLSEFHLEIEAEGFAPAASEPRPGHGEPQPFEFRLVAGEDAAGRVLQPDGYPASGARVALARPGRAMWMHQPGVLESGGTAVRSLVTGSDGHFRLRPAHGDQRVQIVHATGSAFLPIHEARGGDIRLQPWSTVEGVLRIRGRPLTGGLVMLGRQTGSTNTPPAIPDFGYQSRIDDEGRFRFEQVPPGSLTLRTLVPRKVLDRAVEVAPGTTVFVDLSVD